MRWTGIYCWKCPVLERYRAPPTGYSSDTSYKTRHVRFHPVTLPNLQAALTPHTEWLQIFRAFYCKLFSAVFCLSSLSFFLLGGISRTKTKFELILYLVEPPHADVCSSYVRVKFILAHARAYWKYLDDDLTANVCRQTPDPRPS